MKTFMKVFQYADIIILRANSFLLLKLDRLETASSFSLRENKDDANDFSKAGTFQLDSACYCLCCKNVLS